MRNVRLNQSHHGIAHNVVLPDFVSNEFCSMMGRRKVQKPYHLDFGLKSVLVQISQKKCIVILVLLGSFLRFVTDLLCDLN